MKTHLTATRLKSDEDVRYNIYLQECFFNLSGKSLWGVEQVSSRYVSFLKLSERLHHVLLWIKDSPLHRDDGVVCACWLRFTLCKTQVLFSVIHKHS